MNYVGGYRGIGILAKAKIFLDFAGVTRIRWVRGLAAGRGEVDHHLDTVQHWYWQKEGWRGWFRAGGLFCVG
jgi:hypothetical protein